MPGCTDANKGDQALIWETIESIKAAGGIDEVVLIGSAEMSDQCEQQTRALGYEVVSNILRHPRRGRNRPEDKVKEGLVSLVLMMINSLIDLTRSQLFLLLAPFPAFARLLLGAEQRKAYSAYLDARAVFVKGGGFIHAYGGLNAPYQIWYLLFPIRLAQRLKKPVLVLPNSFGPFIGLGVRRQVRNVLSKCAFVCARESVSAKALGALLGREVPVFPDLGYFLSPSTRETGLRICEEFGVPIGEKRCVGFTVRPYRFPGCADPVLMYDKYIDALAALLRHVESLGYHSVLITQVSGPSAHENDALAISDLMKRASSVACTWIDYKGICRDLKAVFGCMDYVVGTRFHSVVFAQGMGVPSMAIAYGGNKATGIMADMDLSDYVIPIDQVTGEGLCAMFDSLVAHDEKVRSRLRGWLVDAATRRDEMVQSLRSAI